jgi:SOS-response transcriptional repressor LexA
MLTERSEPLSITRLQTRALNFIKRYHLEHGEMPTYRQIEAGIDVAVSGVHRLVTCLVERGYLTKGAGRHRSLMLVKTSRAIAVELPPELDDWVRGRAQQIRTSPEAVIIKAVREAMFIKRTQKVSRETSEAA